MTLASLAGQFSRHVLGHGRLLGFVPLFDLNGESNVPAWYSSSTLLLCAGLAAVVGFHPRTIKAKGLALYWRTLALVLAAMSVDEVVQVHEATIVPLRAALGAGGVFYYTWSLVGIALVVVFALMFRPFLAHLSARTRWLFILSGVLYISGALGMELVQGWHDAAHGETGTTAVITTVEEVLEMSGVIVLVYALLTCVDRLAAAPVSDARENRLS
jgi:hypothetical protein